MLAKDVLKETRYILSDMAGDRWSDARLLKLLNNCINDIAKNTTIFVENIFYVVTDLVPDIDLKNDVIKIVRAEYMDEPLPFISFEDADKKFGKLWQQDKGDKVKAIVFDKQRAGVYKQYPIVQNAHNENIVFNQLYGVVTNISYSDIEPILGDYTGDIAAIPAQALIKFYYVRKHPVITDINMELLVDDLTTTAMIHYIAGMALRDNQDTQSRALAQEEISFYDTLVEQYSVTKSELFVKTDMEASYRPYD